VRGTPVPVVEGIRVEPGGAVQASVGDDGTLVYLPGGAATGLQLVWVDRAGREELIDAPPRQFRYPRLSPEGTRVAVQDVGEENDVWVWQLARKTLTRLTFGPAVEGYAAWTPDGRHILFSSSRDKVNAPFWQLADGTGATERLVTGTTPLDQGVVSRDGRWLILRATGAATGEDIVAVDLADKARLQPAGSGGVRPLVQTKFNERNPELSPDGRWLAYQSDESGATEIYVRPFPDVDAGRWQVSAGGGAYPLWGRDGRELFYYGPDDWLVSVPIRSEKSFTFGSAARVVEVSRYYTQLVGRNYDVSADGRRFLVLRGEEEGRADVRVVLNWTEELKRLVPVN
jgi:serine/threonine-protein kinase